MLPVEDVWPLKGRSHTLALLLGFAKSCLGCRQNKSNIICFDRETRHLIVVTAQCMRYSGASSAESFNPTFPTRCKIFGRGATLAHLLLLDKFRRFVVLLEQTLWIYGL
jgi:hypothetical protein